MSLVEQVRSVLSTAVTIEQTCVRQAEQIDALVRQVATLTADNAALRERLEATPPAVPDRAEASAPQWGFVANDTDAAPAVRAGLRRMKADGGGWLRLWHGHFGAFSPATVDMIEAAAALGVRVIVCVQPKDTAGQTLGTPDFTAFVARNAAALRRAYAVEAGNELNLAQYRPDDLGGGLDWHKPYVDRWLRPLSAALAAVGVKTLCTSITDTYHPENYALNYDALLAAGARDCCDGVALHAYLLPQTLQTLGTLVGDLKTKWARPVHVTECNVLTQGVTPAQWPGRFAAYFDALRASGVTSVQFYRGVPKANGKWDWPTLFDKTGVPTDAYGVLLAAVGSP